MKKNKEKIILFLAIIIFLITFLLYDFLIKQSSRVVFCDVGQGDGTFININNDKQILIDGGPDNKFIGCVGKYMPYFDHKIEYVIVSHPDKDHFVGIIEVLKRYDVEYVIVNGDKSDIPEYEEFLFLAKDKIIKPEDNDFLKFLQKGGDSKDSNNNSLVFKFIYNNKSILFTGDAPTEVEEKFLDKDLKSDILKLGHHGSKTSSSKSFLEAVAPELTIISVGADNKYGHPSYLIIKRLENLGIKYLRTDDLGDIEIKLEN